MRKTQHLKKAPIAEGLIDIRVRTRKDLEPSALESGLSAIKGRYPLTIPLRHYHAHLRLEGEQPPQPVVETRRGLRFESGDRRLVFQAQVDGFTVSRLRPYDTWESLLTEAKSLWSEYVRVAQPEAIVRVATRFINRIEIPMPVSDYQEYLTAAPDVPKGFSMPVSEFLSRVVSHDADTGAVVVLSQAMEPVASNVLPLIVDIDVFKQESYDDVHSEEPWELLGRFRHLKNRAFFASITPKTLELLK